MAEAPQVETSISSQDGQQDTPQIFSFTKNNDGLKIRLECGSYGVIDYVPFDIQWNPSRLEVVFRSEETDTHPSLSLTNNIIFSSRQEFEIYRNAFSIFLPRLQAFWKESAEQTRVYQEIVRKDTER